VGPRLADVDASVRWCRFFTRFCILAGEGFRRDVMRSFTPSRGQIVRPVTGSQEAMRL
jgi:hypothetical protein